MAATVKAPDTSTTTVAAAAASLGYTGVYPPAYLDGPAGAASTPAVAAPATSSAGVT